MNTQQGIFQCPAVPVEKQVFASYQENSRRAKWGGRIYGSCRLCRVPISYRDDGRNMFYATAAKRRDRKPQLHTLSGIKGISREVTVIRKKVPFRLVVHYPQTEEGKLELALRVSDVRVQAVNQYLKSLNIPNR